LGLLIKILNIPLFRQGPINLYMGGAEETAILNEAAGHKVDVEALAQAHVNAVAGACLAMGIKYAGSANSGAQATLHEYAAYLLKAKNTAPDSSSGEASLQIDSVSQRQARSLPRICRSH
jgi:anaphase-promoting complex subunit 1